MGSSGHCEESSPRSRGEELSRLFDRMSGARAFKAKIEADIQKSTYVDPRSGKVPFGEWAEQCLEARLHLRPASRARDESYMRNHVLPVFGHLPLAGISKLRVQAWVRKLHEGGLAPATVRECHRLLQGVLSEAVDARLIPESPCRNISLLAFLIRSSATSHLIRSNGSPR